MPTGSSLVPTSGTDGGQPPWCSAGASVNVRPMTTSLTVPAHPTPVARIGVDTVPRPGRDPAVDALRTLCLLAVVLGHWLLAVVSWREGTLSARNLLDVVPATQWGTWLFQPMPLFFVIGGWAGAASWSGRREGDGPDTWVATRIARLLGPVTTYAVVAGVIAAFLAVVLPDAAPSAAKLLAMHLWFLAVFIPISALVPWLCNRVDRHGWWVPGGFAVAVVTVDILRFLGGASLVGWANFAFVWLLFAALGVAVWFRPPRTGAIVVSGAIALGLLIVTVALGWYPHSMVGVGERSNNTPPTVALALLGVAQAAAGTLMLPVLRRALHRRPAMRKATGVLGALSMHLYLWHLVAVLVAVWLMGVTGIGDVAPVSVTWWCVRPLWLAALALLTTPVVGLAVRFDRRRMRAAGLAVVDDRTRVVAATLLAGGTCAVLAMRSFGLGPVALAGVVMVHFAMLTVRRRVV